MWPFVHINNAISHRAGAAGCCRMLQAFCSPDSVSTLRGSYGGSSSRCLIGVFHRSTWVLFFPVNCRINLFLWHVQVKCVSIAQACTNSAARVFLDLGLRHFTWAFLQKTALLTCPCAFRLRRLAQNGCPSLGARHFTWELLLLWHLSMCISTAQARTKRLPWSWGAAFFLSILA